MPRSPRRPGRVTPKGTTPTTARPSRRDAESPRPRAAGPGRADGRIHEPRRGYVPPSTNRTGYRGNR
jgi:hypothetical protein